MNTRIFNISLAVFWFTIFVGMMTRNWWMPPWLLAKAETPQTPMIVAVSLMLTVWNLARYWRSKVLTAPKSRISEEMRLKTRPSTGEDPKVTDPEFIFDEKTGAPPKSGG